ncbi:putative transcription factor, K-box [Helianthus annuus]|nr:putative transcription factor, K-box [Helianthus annuus]
MVKTLEKYHSCSFGSLKASQPENESQYNYHEYLRLKARVEVLQRSQRNLLGEDLAPLNTKELEQLEHQLETSLRKIRSTKTQSMLNQLAELQRKEQVLAETNKALRNKLEENAQEFPRQMWEANAQTIPYNPLPTHSDEFFQPLGLNTAMHNRFTFLDFALKNIQKMDKITLVFTKTDSFQCCVYL